MIKNEGVIDRLIRLVLAIIFLVIAYFYAASGLWQTVFYVLAAVSLITTLTGFCLFYQIFGINTHKKN